MKVLKFGGTSVANAENIRKVRTIVEDKMPQGRMMVVVSALGGITNTLIECCQAAAKGDPKSREIFKIIEQRHLETTRDLIPVKSQSGVLAQVMVMLNELEEMLQGVFLVKEISPRTQDFVTSFGERLSSFIISQYFIHSGIKTKLLDSRELIKTDSNFGKAEVDFETTYQNIKETAAQEYPVFIAPGFISSNAEGVTTTLGRGGSDYTAALLAAGVHAEMLEIWTDVEGMMTADPRIVKRAFPIPEITYKETMELSHFGAKVVYPPTVRPVLTREIPIVIKNTFKPDAPGTLISKNSKPGDFPVRGLSSIAEVALMSINGSGLIGVPGISMRLFGALFRKGINVILITQASSEHAITFAIDPADVENAHSSIREEFKYELELKKIEDLEIERGLSILAMVGENMFRQVGIAGKMFSTLGMNGVNIRAIAQGSSERNISVVIERKDLEKAVIALHESFFLSDVHTLHVFLAGVGNVGKTLLEQIQAQQSILETQHQIRLKVVGMANSKQMAFDAEGIELENWKAALDAGQKLENPADFSQAIIEKNLPYSVFVDCTANAGVSELYLDLLRSSVSVVTANKIACASAYENYAALKSAAVKFGAKFLFETNVGAGLPVINTLQDLMKSGDRIRKIEAVLSGTLNYIFNHFKSGVEFEEIVRAAQAAGFTEPDPRLDLNGMDVMRKILILARESGQQLEAESVEVVQFVPAECLNAADVPAFYDSLKSHNDHFEKMVQNAESQGKKLRFVASYENGNCKAALELVGEDHPFYNLAGKDNIVLFYTDRYAEQPLVIRGAGAGAEVTAAGVFGDLMRLGKS